MKKKEFLDAVKNQFVALTQGHDRYKTTIPDVHRVLNAIITTIQDELKTDAMECKVPGLGTFRLVTRAARSGRNPHTGEAIEIPEKMVVKFKAAKGF